MKNWKTTISGVIVIATAIYLFYIGEKLQGGATLIIGIGLLSAKDDNVTGGRIQQ